MFCRQCGKETPEHAVVCPNCGASLKVSVRFCQSCGLEASRDAVVCLRCGAALATMSPQLKSRLVAALLGIFLGGLGIHRFYLGYAGIGVIQIVVTMVTCGFGGLWGLIEGVLIIAGNINHDAQGRLLRE